MSSYEPDVSLARLGDRALFPELAGVYLAHAAVSPPSSEVRRAALACIDDVAQRGVGAAGKWKAQRDRLKARLASLVSASPHEIALVPSTTRGIVDVASSLPWRRGDRVLTFRGEFPANVTPWQRAAETFGLELVMLDIEGEALERELARGARLVAVSAVQFQTGLSMPLDRIGALCRRHGAELFVDAIQALGVVPIDVSALPIDYLSCGSHKWLMGLEGAAFVYVRSGRALVPRTAGWLSHVDPLEFLFEGGKLRYDRPLRQGADLLESGASNAVGFAALEAAVACLMAIGVPAIFAHVQRWHDAIEPELIGRGWISERHPELRSGALCVRPPPTVALRSLSRALERRGITVSTPDGRLRLAPHWPNDLDQVPLVLAAIDQAAQE